MAIAWVLVAVLGLLLALLVAVLAFGVVRRLRQRHPPPRDRHPPSHPGADAPGPWGKKSGGDPDDD